MRKVFLPALFALLSVLSVFSQDPVATLQHAGGTQNFYGANSFTDAYNQSVSGDTILLSAGGFRPPYYIEKSNLTIIGNGHMPDSTLKKNRTSILDDLNIGFGGNNVTVEGLYINRWFRLMPGNNRQIDNVVVKRCRIGEVPSTQGSDIMTNISFVECLLEGDLHFTSNDFSDNLKISNSIFYGILKYVPKHLILENCIFLKNSSDYLLSVNSSLIKNNIFISGTQCYSGYNNTFYNNIFLVNNPVFGTQSTGSNNNSITTADNLFINKNTDFYNSDFHLSNPLQFIGTDGTQVGIYGGLQPFKTSLRPSNPQIISKSVSTKTDNTGQLQVNFTVKAQDN